MAAEGATSIIAASLPALRAFVVDKTSKPHRRPNWLLPTGYGGNPLNQPHSMTTRKTPSASSWRGSSSRPGSAAAAAAAANANHAAAGSDAGRSLYPTDYDLIYSTEWDHELPDPGEGDDGDGGGDGGRGGGSGRESPRRSPMGSRAQLTEAHLARHSLV